LEDNNNNQAVVFYFSGTGNTWWVSEEMVKALTRGGLQAKAYSIEKITDEKAVQLIQNAGIVGFGYPIHGSDLPLPMKKFIERLPLVPDKKAFSFCTQWYWSGDGAAIGAAMLGKKGFKVNWGEHFLMPNNVSVSVIRLPYTNDPERIKRILTRADQKIKRFADRIIKGVPSKRGFNCAANALGSMQRKPYRHFYHKLQNDIGIDQAHCIDCGECIRLCPVGNLYYDGPVIKTRGTCIICLRCYNFCPVAAITYMGRPHRQNRGEPYRGPVKNFNPRILISESSFNQ